MSSSNCELYDKTGNIALDEQRQLRAKQVEVLYDQVRVGLATTVVAALILVGVFWVITPQPMLIAWFALFIFITSLHSGLIHRYQRSSDGLERTDYWLAWFIAGTAASGTTWGLTVILLVPEGSMVHLGFVALWVCGVAAGSVASLSAVKGAFLAFSLPAFIPGATYLLFTGERLETAIGGALFVYFGFLVLNALRMHQTILHSLKLQFENRQLVAYLDAEKERIEKLNDQLEQRVTQRTADLTAANAHLQEEIAERKRVEATQRQHVHYVECLQRIAETIGRSFDPDELLLNVITSIRSIFQADRAWLLYPCDPEADAWMVPVESTVAQYPGASARGGKIPNDTDSAQFCREALDTNEPLILCPMPSGIALAERFSIRSQMMMVIRPRFGQPWLLGMHQCAYAREWANEEQRLFEDIGARLGDVLGAAHLRRELQQSEERLKLALEGANDGLWDWNIATDEVYYSPRWQTMLGFQPGEVEPHLRSWKDRLHPDDKEDVLRVLTDHLKGRTPSYETEHRLRSKDGRWVWILARGKVVEWNKAGKSVRAVGTHTDITERKQAEETATSLGRILEESLNEIYIFDAETFQIIQANRGARINLEYSMDELRRLTPVDLKPNITRETFAKTLQPLRSGEKDSIQFTSIHRRKDGTLYPVEVHVQASTLGALPVFVAIILDITERTQAEEAFRRVHFELERRVQERTADLTVANQRLQAQITARKGAEERYRALYEDNPSMYFTVDAEATVLSVNRFAAVEFGYEVKDLLGQSLLNIFHEDDRKAVQQHVRICTQHLDKVFNWECRMVRQDGSILWVKELARAFQNPDGRSVILTVCEDVTERKQAKERLREHQAQLAHVARLSTMGELATSIAHEVNQPLSAIANYARGCVRILHRGTENPDALIDVMEKIGQQAERAGEVIRRTREFVRKDEPKDTEVDINDLVRGVIMLVDYELRLARLEPRLEMTERLPPILADAIQIEQVILNLVCNAIEAMEGSTGPKGKLIIRTSSPTSNIIEVAISDKGHGLPGGRADQVFDPFFTTKSNGMGMGLSISYSIVEAYGGRMWATPNPAGGATFRFTLPSVQAVQNDKMESVYERR